MSVGSRVERLQQRVAPSLHVRVEDAALVAQGGPARLSLTGLPGAQAVADAVADVGGTWAWNGTRLVVTVPPPRLVDAAGRVGGPDLGERVREALERALTGWHGPPSDLHTSGPTLPTSQRPLVMGVLNVTPDSFSDGGVHLVEDRDPRPAIAAGVAMATTGADVVDVGGVSTRPGAAPVDVDEELRRVVGVVAGIAGAGVVVSVDTSSAVVAREAVAAGATIVNDVSAGRFDPLLLPTVAELGVGYVSMHMQGSPSTMQRAPHYDDVVAEVADLLAAQLDALAAHGVRRDHVAIDPGIGFGKTLGHNLALLARLRELTCFGLPIVVGVSRKSFLGTIGGAPDPGDRLPGSLAAASLAVASGARIVRAHDVPQTLQAIRVAHAIAGA